ncbi:MAG TPA: HEPN domain-containing protein [Saprospiraceae bacterium]|nr:HEPN domain-containing protein [Saprospiraceae bacterium]
MEYVGEFWLPGKDEKFPGKVIIDDNKKIIKIILYGNHAIDGTKIEKLGFSNYTKYHEIIVGNTSSGYISLIDCNWRSTSQIGKGIMKIIYYADIKFSQVHVSSLSDLKVKNLVVKFAWLDSWIDGMNSLSKVEKLNEGNTITHNITINENLKLILIDNLWKSPLLLTSSQKTNYCKYLKLSFNEPEEFNKAIDYIFRFKMLLDFCLQRSNGIKLINFETEAKLLDKYKQSLERDKLCKVTITNYSLENDDFEGDHFKHQNKMLISRWKFSESELERIIKSWYNQKGLDHIHDFYLNSFEISRNKVNNVIYNNACLNLLQSLEDLHRRKYGDDKLDPTSFNQNKKDALNLLNSNPKIKKWVNDNLNFTKVFTFKERMVSLVKKAEHCIKTILGSTEFYDLYPQLAKKFRNSLSHANFESTYQGENLHLVYALTKILLTIHLLKTLDIDDNKINQSLENSNFIGDLTRDIYPVYNSLQKDPDSIE